jgi:V/A-type H+-transporting ATPase subunit I
MILRMKKISVKGQKKDLRNVIDALKSTGVFELGGKRVRQEHAHEKHDELEAMLGRIKGLLDFTSKAEVEVIAATKKAKKNNGKTKTLQPVKSKDDFVTPSSIEYKELKAISTREGEILTLIGRVEDLSAKYYETKAEIARNSVAAEELRPYKNLNVALNTMHDTEHAFVLAGIIGKDDLARFRSDYDLEDIYIEEFTSSGDNTCVVFIGHNDDEPIVHTIYDYGFERCKFNFNVTAAEKIAEFEKENKALRKDLSAVMQQACLSKRDIGALQMYYDYIANELDTEDVIASTLTTENFFIINGWIVEKAENEIKVLLHNVAREVSVKTDAISERDYAPSYVKSNRVIKPYQSITNMYGAPGARDLDPNLFVAFFYFVFFGIMISDIGYGIVMSVVATIILVWFKPKGRGARDLVAIIGMGGISALLWGLFLSNIFGTTLGFLPKAVINPIDDAMLFLELTLGLGFVHILVGTILKFYNLARQGRFVDAICDAFFRITLLCGIGIAVLGLLLPSLAKFSNIGMIIAGVSLGLIALTAGRKNKGIMGKITGGFGGIYSIVNYFSDILSYARLFGLGLVGAVIGMVANQIGGMLMGIAVIGPVLGIIVMVIFHALNLAIGLLSAYVHNARLQFVEFFGKFYEGSGKPFVPFGRNTKYVTIRQSVVV